MKDNAD